MPVIILGMHRSGTSAITRCVNLMGPSIGREDDLVPADGGNERGYWENASLVRLNDDILTAWDGIWFAPPKWPENWAKDERLSQTRPRAVQALHDAFPAEEWVWKDPRNCLTLLFWREVLAAPPCIVFVWRDPEETCRSLERAHGLPPQIGTLLWSVSNRSALVSAAGLPTFVVSYAELLNDTWAILERLRVFLAQSGVKVADSVPQNEVRSFLDPSLRHHKSGASGSRGEHAGSFEQQAMLTYLRQLRETHASLSLENLPRLPAFAHEILAAHQEYSRANLRLAEATTLCHERAGEIVMLRRDLSIAQTTLDAIYRSKGWHALQTYRKVKESAIRQGRRAVRVGRQSARAAYFLLTDREEFKIRWRRWRGMRGLPGDQRPEIQSALGMQGKAYAAWLSKFHPPVDREAARRRIKMMTVQPKFSIVMPAYNTTAGHLRAAIESVRRQLYENWELCIADDASPKAHVRDVLNEYAAKDQRIRIRLLDKNLGIAGASNAAISLATGDFVGLLDHDDELDPAALLEVAALLNEHPDTDMIYTDEDKLDLDGRRRDPFFKPNWSPTTFLSYMYTCHFGVYRKTLIDSLGGFRQGVDGSQDYDLVLRLTEQTSRIRHIPKVLYHWRMTPQSTAMNPSNKNYTEQAASKALADAMQRRGVPVTEIAIGRLPTTYRVRYRLPAGAVVHMIIPSKNNVGYLRRCLRSILEKTAYQDYRIHVVDNGSDDAATLAYLDELQREPRVRVLHYNHPFNYSAINNWAISQIDGQYLLLLNDDTEVIAPDWLEAMLEQAGRPEVGAVGAKLLYPDGRIQHGGVILGIGGVAAHAHKYYSASHPGYFSRLEVVQNFSAVTAACLMTRREVFDQVGGFNETDLAVAFNDVDLCLRIREAGYQIIYTPFAELYHHESVSRGLCLSGDEVGYMQHTWGRLLVQDPFYNPNLTMRREDFSLCP